MQLRYGHKTYGNSTPYDRISSGHDESGQSGNSEASYCKDRYFLCDFSTSGFFLTHAILELNEASSRSHLIIILSVYVTGVHHRTEGRLYLVDLAGSEDHAAAGKSKERADEGNEIRTSLVLLSKLLRDLGTKGKVGLLSVTIRKHSQSILRWKGGEGLT